MKIISWNINGIRAWIKKDGLNILDKENPDILLLQETRCKSLSIPFKTYKDYIFYHLEKDENKRKGYAGVGVYSKHKPLNVIHGIGNEKFDKESRIITLEFLTFYLICVYTPNAGDKLVRLDYRIEWDNLFYKFSKKLDAKKPIISAGDFNVAHEKIDVAHPDKNHAGFTDEERENFTKLINIGFVDTFRYFYPNQKNIYTYWAYWNTLRDKNIGWRIDYFLCSNRFIDNILDSKIMNEYYGSDHCPIMLIIK